MKGILFTPDNIRAIREHRKTQTRRLHGLKVVNESPDSWHLADFYQSTGGNNKWWAWFSKDGAGDKPYLIMPRYQPTETVYLKEAWKVIDIDTRTLDDPMFHVKVEYKDGYCDWGFHVPRKTKFTIPDKWHSPMFLPEGAARDFITITDVKPERLRDISEEDAIAEGMTLVKEQDCGPMEFPISPQAQFQLLWDSINRKDYPWGSNPWVWAYKFELTEGKL